MLLFSCPPAKETEEIFRIRGRPGKHDYYDKGKNIAIMEKIAKKCYLR
jgi:hypothetical protein